VRLPLVSPSDELERGERIRRRGETFRFGTSCLLSRLMVELANTFKRATRETQKRIVQLDLTSAFVILIYTAYCSNETIMACYHGIFLFKKERVLYFRPYVSKGYSLHSISYSSPLLMLPAAMPHEPDSSHPPTAYSQSPNIKLSILEN
jgi:hypothetical protein